MMTGTLVAMLIAAGLGMILASLHLARRADLPWLGFLHGVAAGTAFVLFLVSSAALDIPDLSVVAVSLKKKKLAPGFVLFAADLSGRPLPRWLLAWHAGLALLAVVLAVIAFSHGAS